MGSIIGERRQRLHVVKYSAVCRFHVLLILLARVPHALLSVHSVFQSTVTTGMDLHAMAEAADKFQEQMDSMARRMVRIASQH